MHYFAQNIWFSMSFYLLYELYWGEKDKDRSEKKKNLFLFLFFFYTGISPTSDPIKLMRTVTTRRQFIKHQQEQNSLSARAARLLACPLSLQRWAAEHGLWGATGGGDTPSIPRPQLPPSHFIHTGSVAE